VGGSAPNKATERLFLWEKNGETSDHIEVSRFETIRSLAPRLSIKAEAR
jgi:hypothetical protein